MSEEREGCIEPNCRRCLEISRITNRHDRELADWSHNSFEQIKRKVQKESKLLDEASRNRTFMSTREDPFPLSRAKPDTDFTASVKTRCDTYSVWQVLWFMLALVAGMVIGMVAAPILL